MTKAAATKYSDFSPEIGYTMRYGKSDKDGRSEVACGALRDSHANSPPSQERRWPDGDQGADRDKLADQLRMNCLSFNCNHMRDVV